MRSQFHVAAAYMNIWTLLAAFTSSGISIPSTTSSKYNPSCAMTSPLLVASALQRRADLFSRFERDDPFGHQVRDLVLRIPEEIPVHVFVVLAQARPRLPEEGRGLREADRFVGIGMRSDLAMFQADEVLTVLQLRIGEQVSAVLHDPCRDPMPLQEPHH